MPHQYRLTDRATIKKCVRIGTKIYTRYLIIKYIKTLTQTNKKFAVVVSKKVDKRATVRNRIKRQFRAIMTQYAPNFPQGYYVIIVKDTSNNILYSELKKDLLRAFDIRA